MTARAAAWLDVRGDRVVCACGSVDHVPEFLADGDVLCPEGTGDDGLHEEAPKDGERDECM